MIRGYVNRGDRLQAVETALDRDDAFVWIDLISPTQDEEAEIEARLGIDLPSREDMEEIEISSRLYQDAGAVFMTANLPAQTDEAQPVMAPVPFILAGQRPVHLPLHQPARLAPLPPQPPPRK